MLDATPPALWAPTPDPALPRKLCTDCGLSRSKLAGQCGKACQFIKPDYEALEQQVHGRIRDPNRADESFFGPFRAMYKAALRDPAPGAQWTGLTTRLAQKLLETGKVDAILGIGPHPDDKWRPQPVIVTDPQEVKHLRGMRMGYAPLLSLLEPAASQGLTRLAVIGIPCQVYALRAIERQLGLDALYVIGTPCSDNTSTDNFHEFLSRLSDTPERITYLEFRADYHVELRFDDGTQRDIPFLKLPLSDLPSDFFPITCRTCVDYTNTLSDITVGYMGGDGVQWIIARNTRGEDLLNSLGDEVLLEVPGSSGKRAGSVKGFAQNTARAAGGLPLRRMPDWARGLVGWLMPRIGPKGLEFARARVEMKAVESILHLRRAHPRRMRHMIPKHVWALAAPYDLTPEPGETHQDEPRGNVGAEASSDKSASEKRHGPRTPGTPSGAI